MHAYSGNWFGTYVIRACDQSGIFEGWCQGIGGVGAVLPISLALDQNGSDRCEMSGTVSLGMISGDVRGNVTEDGRMVLDGSFNFVSDSVMFTLTFGGWNTSLTTNHEAMTGRWAQSLRAVGVAGNAYQENEILSVTRLSSVPTITPAPSQYRMTIPDAASRMRVRPMPPAIGFTSPTAGC